MAGRRVRQAQRPETPLAFFPGYPALVRWVDGLPGVDLIGAAFTVSLVSGVFCAYGLHRLGRRVRGGSREAGLILVALFAASPMAVVLSMTYSEATFCALAAWSLVGVVERRWILAGRVLRGRPGWCGRPRRRWSRRSGSPRSSR